MVHIPEEGFTSHPIADMFPMMKEENIRELAEDIRAHGLQNRIELYAGKILDGRNRYEALKLLGKHEISPYFNDMTDTFFRNEENIVPYVISKNIHRRHLTNGQKAEIGIQAKKVQAAMAKERQAENALRNQPQSQKVENFPPSEKMGKARDMAAKALGISGRMIDHAEKVFGEDNTAIPELQEAVRKGNASISAAAKVADLPGGQQRQAVATGKKGVARAAQQTQQYPPEKQVHKSSTVTILRTKDLMKIYLPRNHSQLFAVELRDNFTKDYLRECFKDLEKLWGDTEGDSSCTDPATH